jgi:hypothetical protein
VSDLGAPVRCGDIRVGAISRVRVLVWRGERPIVQLWAIPRRGCGAPRPIAWGRVEEGPPLRVELEAACRRAIASSGADPAEVIEAVRRTIVDCARLHIAAELEHDPAVRAALERAARRGEGRPETAS